MKYGEKLRKVGVGSGGRGVPPGLRGWVGGRCKFTGESGENTSQIHGYVSNNGHFLRYKNTPQKKFSPAGPKLLGGETPPRPPPILLLTGIYPTVP